MDVLGEFLREAARSRKPWHCSTDAADWCMECGHPDFAWAWRASMTDEESVEATRGDGLVKLWDEGIRDDLPVVSDVERGDIAVVSKMGLEAGAIFTGERWAIRSTKGITYVPRDSVTVIKAWRP